MVTVWASAPSGANAAVEPSAASSLLLSITSGLRRHSIF
jgi:hypothetical protein